MSKLQSYIDNIRRLMKSSDNQLEMNAIGNNLMRDYYRLLSSLPNTITQEKIGSAQFNIVVEAVQIGLVFLGYNLPKFGVDGKFGTETASAIRNFRNDNNLEVPQGSEFIDTKFVRALSERLRNSKMSADDIVKITSNGVEISDGDGNTDWYDEYVDICERFIKRRGPNPLNITGEMMAQCALSIYNRYKILVPAQLALAQMVLEGGIGNGNRSSRPIRTRNPFNIGNVDDGRNKFYPNVVDGICDYYSLMARKYLGNMNGKTITPNDLLSNFVNKEGNRYASDPNYENKLKSIIRTIA